MLPARKMPGLSPAVESLGLGGAQLSAQVADETEEQRKKRMKELQERSLMGAGGTPATLALLGGSV